MTENEALAYGRGSQAAYRELLGVALCGLGREAMPDTLAAALKRIAQLEAHLADARAKLRSVCEEFGDNDWSDDSHLPDVIENHLIRNIRENGRIASDGAP